MLWNASAVNGFGLQTSDGKFGHASDLLFEDVNWSLRWLIVNTQIWPFGRTVDLPLSTVGGPDFATRCFHANETLDALDASLSLDEHSLRRNEPHLQSAAALIGYAVAATDGEIGHVENLLVDNVDATIEFLTVHTADWWPGGRVLIAPASIVEVDTKERRLALNIDGASERAAPVFDARTAVDGVEESKYLTNFCIRCTQS